MEITTRITGGNGARVANLSLTERADKARSADPIPEKRQDLLTLDYVGKRTAEMLSRQRMVRLTEKDGANYFFREIDRNQ